jgi:hypothetical protein
LREWLISFLIAQLFGDGIPQAARSAFIPWEKKQRSKHPSFALLPALIALVKPSLIVVL